MGHQHHHAFASFNALDRDGLTLLSRRNMLKAGLAGIAGLSVPRLLQERVEAADAGRAISDTKSVILLWMTGGPSHIDTWDPKPARPLSNRGPFSVIPTKLPGAFICEHLPKQAAMLDKFTLIRSVDCRFSSHEPNRVMQTANRLARPRSNPRTGDKYPAMASVVAKFRGPNNPAMPPYVAFMKARGHIGWGGYLGKAHDPFIGNQAASLPIVNNVGKLIGHNRAPQIFNLPGSLTQRRITDRRTLLQDFDRLRSDLDQSGSMQAIDAYSRQAVELVVGGTARKAFDISREPQAIRDRYGPHIWCQQALLARRLVAAGVNFVTIDLSYHTASGTWDTHGDNIPPYGGIEHGLGPLLPLFDHLITTLVADLEDHGLLDDTLVLAMGDFGRTPIMGTQGSTDGRNHWPVVMSMALAGGGLKHGQVIGATERDGGHIKSRPVTPGDIAATIYRHMQVPLDAAYLDNRGRPIPIVQNGAPIRELF